VVSFILQPLYTWGKNAQIPLYRRRGRSLSEAGRDGEEKITATTGNWTVDIQPITITDQIITAAAADTTGLRICD